MVWRAHVWLRSGKLPSVRAEFAASTSLNSRQADSVRIGATTGNDLQPCDDIRHDTGARPAGSLTILGCSTSVQVQSEQDATKSQLSHRRSLIIETTFGNF